MGIFDSNYDFNKYKFFYAVATCKSFSKAAELMHISQPAISYAVKELEEQLDTKLFIRNKNGVVLTETAEKLLSYVKNAFDNLSMVENVIENTKGDLSGTIRIGIYTHIAIFIMPKAIKDFKAKYPNANFYIYSTSHAEMVSMLRNKELDMLILQYPIFFGNGNFKEEILFEIPTCFYGNKEYYDRFCKNNNSIDGMSISLPIPGFHDIDGVREIAKERNLNIKQELTSYASEVSRRFAKEGLCAAWGLKKSIEEDLEDGSLYELPVDFELPTSKFSMVYNEELLNDTAKEFATFLKENIDKYTKI